MPSIIRGTSATGSIKDDLLKYHPIQQVRTLYIEFVQHLFAQQPSGSYKWLPDMTQTEIVITDENVLKASAVGKRPAVTFTRGQLQFFSLGMDDMLSYDFTTGAKTKSVLIPGVMSINCLSRVDIEAENLAFAIAENLWMNREILMQKGFFEIGRQPTLTAASPAGAIVQGDMADGWYLCTVQSPFQIYRTSRITPFNTQQVAEIGMTINTEPPPALNGGGPLAQVSGLPYGVTAQYSAPGLPAPAQPSPEQAQNPAALPLVPHPLNPAQMVTVRSANPYAPGLRRPSINGRPIPIQAATVEESVKSMTTTVKIKV